jgi:predicted dehydrogenase
MNVPDTLRVAVLGAGRMGRHHARVYSTLAHCRLLAVVDKDLDRARAVAAEFGGRALSTIGKLPDDLDAVSVAVPTVFHAEVAIPLLERGIPVLVEKPLAPDTQSAARLLEASRRNHCLLQVGHSERFNPVVQAMLRMEVKPRFIETQRVSPFTFRSADIGVVFDMMIHDIDIILHLVKESAGNERAASEGTIAPSPESSRARSAFDDRELRIDGPVRAAGRADYTLDAIGVNVLGEFEDVASARIRFSDGTVANLTASRLALKTDRRIRVFCPTAYLTMDYQRKSGIAVKLADNLDLIRMARERNFEDLSQMASLDFGSMVKVEPLAVDDVEPLRAEIEAFLNAIRTGSGTGVSAEDGYAAVEMAERITAAVREQGLTVRT